MKKQGRRKRKGEEGKKRERVKKEMTDERIDFDRDKDFKNRNEILESSDNSNH